MRVTGGIFSYERLWIGVCSAMAQIVKDASFTDCSLVSYCRATKDPLVS